MPKATPSQVRALVRRRKKASAVENIPVTPDLVEKARDAARLKLTAVLEEYVTFKSAEVKDRKKYKALESVALDIEGALFDKHSDTGAGYRADFRKLFFSLKEKLLLEEISGNQLVHMPLDELRTKAARDKNTHIKQENMRLATINAAEQPESIKAFDDGRVREKWWGGSSHAAIDDD